MTANFEDAAIGSGAEWVDPAERDNLPEAWAGQARGWARTKVRFGDGLRPWNWAELDTAEAEKLWALLRRFVVFFNARYAPEGARRVPPCWAEHGALIEELTTLWWAHWQAFESAHASIGGAQYWHSYTLPGFFERMSRWLGDDALACGQGRHRDGDNPAPATTAAWEARTERIVALDLQLRRPRQLELGLDDTGLDGRGLAPRSGGVEVPFLEREK
jgi:hypothetical protein